MPASPPPAGFFLRSVWAPIRQAACEAIHRAIVEGRNDPTNTDLHEFTPELKQRIRRFVCGIDERSLSRLVARDMEQNGYFRAGWSARWPDSGPRARSVPPDPSREHDSARMPPRE